MERDKIIKKKKSQKTNGTARRIILKRFLTPQQMLLWSFVIYHKAIKQSLFLGKDGKADKDYVSM